ncbi:hypothetical protein NE237_029638 [Protea cynaroides]|uniref:Uncharacterized protein n=1 Tax=Protea cynaroides TaxID=273540 RepID=A0A9Q0GRJ0_9MAGN|nr:hypothetical protein NE237_029638 [Protea cynaroides]
MLAGLKVDRYVWQYVTLLKATLLETRAKLLLRGGHFYSGEELCRTCISIRTVMLGHNHALTLAAQKTLVKLVPFQSWEYKFDTTAVQPMLGHGGEHLILSPLNFEAPGIESTMDFLQKKKESTVDLTPFKLDIDELINDFSESNSTTLDEMKRVWLSRKFSYIYEAKPAANLAFFMQSLYAHSVGHMVMGDSLSRRLGGLYCLYCLYETQPSKPPFKIYLSLGELKNIKSCVVDAKKESIKVVPALVKRMLEKNMFLFGCVDINEASATERVNEINKQLNARMQIAYKKLFANSRIDHFLHLDLGMELDLKALDKMSTEYARAKELAINEAGKLVDIQNIKHIAENNKLIGDEVKKIAKDWNVQKDMFYQQTRLNHHEENNDADFDEDTEDPLKVQEENNHLEFDRELENYLSQ